MIFEPAKHSLASFARKALAVGPRCEDPAHLYRPRNRWFGVPKEIEEADVPDGRAVVCPFDRPHSDTCEVP